jgi:putative PIN family toxin of toxin-antitoxin system
MLRIFIVDTNVLVAGLITARPESPTVRIVDAMLDGRLIYMLSPELLSEYRAVLLRPKLTRLHGLEEIAIDTLLTEITANAIWCEPLPNSGPTAPDPNDPHLWSLLAANASAVLVTGDRLLLDDSGPHAAAVITPAVCADLITVRRP